ncbi:hypothetical protein IT418_02820 [bacterium]|nr:hypothetical protein [bacterium]
MTDLTVSVKRQPPVDLGRVFVDHAHVAKILETYLDSPSKLWDSKKVEGTNLSLRELFAEYVIFQVLSVLLESGDLKIGAPKDKQSAEIDDGYIKIGDYRYILQNVSAFVEINANGINIVEKVRQEIRQKLFGKSANYVEGTHLVIVTDAPLDNEIPNLRGLLEEIKQTSKIDFESYWLIGIKFEDANVRILVEHYDPDDVSFGVIELRTDVTFIKGDIYRIPVVM